MLRASDSLFCSCRDTYSSTAQLENKHKRQQLYPGMDGMTAALLALQHYVHPVQLLLGKLGRQKAKPHPVLWSLSYVNRVTGAHLFIAGIQSVDQRHVPLLA